jgi:NADH-quinone oxidoreductase subunit C
MSAELNSALAQSGHLLESGEGDYAVDGFHHVHTCAPETIAPIVGVFREAGCFLEMITAVDLRFVEEGVFRLVYTFNHFEVADRHRIHVDVKEDASVPSVVSCFPAADWMEREVYDMYGIIFSDHPDLRRILLPEDADFHALRKDFGQMNPESEETAEEAEEGGDE